MIPAARTNSWSFSQTPTLPTLILAASVLGCSENRQYSQYQGGTQAAAARISAADSIELAAHAPSLFDSLNSWGVAVDPGFGALAPARQLLVSIMSSSIPFHVADSRLASLAVSTDSVHFIFTVEFETCPEPSRSWGKNLVVEAITAPRATYRDSAASQLTKRGYQLSSYTASTVRGMPEKLITCWKHKENGSIHRYVAHLIELTHEYELADSHLAFDARLKTTILQHGRAEDFADAEMLPAADSDWAQADSIYGELTQLGRLGK